MLLFPSLTLSLLPDLGPTLNLVVWPALLVAGIVLILFRYPKLFGDPSSSPPKHRALRADPGGHPIAWRSSRSLPDMPRKKRRGSKRRRPRPS